MSNLTPEVAAERIAKLKDQKAFAVQAANAQLAPLEGQAFQIAEQKAVVISNANLEIGKIDGQLLILEELFGPPSAVSADTAHAGPVLVPAAQE